MRRLRRSLGAVCIVAGFIAAVPVTASAASEGHHKHHAAGHFKLAHKGTLTVAASATPPDFVISPTGKVTGIVATVLKTFAKAHHLKVTFDKYSFSGSLTAVESGRADITGAFYYTKTRAKAVFYTYPYTVDGSFLVYLNTTKYKKPSTFLGKTVGVAAGYAQVPYMQKYLGTSHVVQFTADPAGIEAVKTGRVAGFISGNTVLWYARTDKALKVVRLKPGTFDQPATVTNQSDNMMVSCHNVGLAKAVDATMKQMVKNGKLKKVIDKYGYGITYTGRLVSHPNLCGK